MRTGAHPDDSTFGSSISLALSTVYMTRRSLSFGAGLTLVLSIRRTAGEQVPQMLALPTPPGRSQPIYFAAQAGNLEAVQALLDRGVSINTPNWRGQRPIHFVQDKGNEFITSAAQHSMMRLWSAAEMTCLCCCKAKQSIYN